MYTSNASKVVVVPHQNVVIYVCMWISFSLFDVPSAGFISGFIILYFEEAECSCLVSLCRHPCVLCHILGLPFVKGKKMSLNKH